jgi:hypothetical protein
VIDRNSLLTLAAGLGCTVAAVFGADALVRAADHGDSPQVRVDTRADINDLYVFASPQTPANTVLVMTVCPVAGITAPKEFATTVKYQFGVDTNGDFDPDQTFTMVFKKPDATGHQKFTLTGPSKLKLTGTTDDLAITFGTGGKVFAGLPRPFFFDLIGWHTASRSPRTRAATSSTGSTGWSSSSGADCLLQHAHQFHDGRLGARRRARSRSTA